MGPESSSPLLAALDFLGKFYGKPVNLHGAIHGLPIQEGNLTPEQFGKAAERCGFASRIVERPVSQLHAATLPAIILLENNDVAVLTGKPDSKRVELVVPGHGHGVQTVKISRVNEIYTGFAILVKPTFDFEKRSDFAPEDVGRNWFWGTLWRFRSFYSRVAVATVMINLLALASSLFIMNVYDRVIPNEAFDTLMALAVGAVAAYGLEFALKSLRTFFVDRAGHRIDLILGGDLFSRVLGMRFGNRPASSGALAGQARSYEGLREFFTSATISALVDLPFVFVFAGVVYLMGGIVALPLLIGAILAITWGALMQLPIMKAVEASYRANNQRHALFVESVNALETIKATRSESELQKRMEECVNVSAKADGTSRVFSQLALNMTGLIQQLVTVGIVFTAFFQVTNEAMSMGAMIACVILAGRAMAPLTMVASLLSRLQQSRRSLKGLDQIMQAPLERAENGSRYIRVDQFQPSVEANHLSFTWDTEAAPVLDDVNFRVDPGDRMAILGKVGSGKSTLLRLMSGLYEPATGGVSIANIDLHQFDPAELRRRMGYVPQEPTLLYGTIRSNLKAGCPWVTDEAMWQAIERAGLADYIRSLPGGVDHPVSEGGRSLSGGQRQCMAIARALMEDPTLLIMDEPTSAMDWNTEQKVLGHLRNWLSEDPQRTLIVATHKRSLLSVVNRILVLDGGSVTADGPRDTVLRQEPSVAPSRRQDVAEPTSMPAPAMSGGRDDVALHAFHSPSPETGAPEPEPSIFRVATPPAATAEANGMPAAFTPNNGYQS